MLKNRLLLFMAFVCLSSSSAQADDFEKLEASQKKLEADNPIRGKKYLCTAKTESGIELKLTYSFYATGSYFLNLGVGIAKSGSWKLANDSLHLEEKAMRPGAETRTRDYKTKQDGTGFKYIHEVKGKQTIYSCAYLRSL